MCVRSWCHRDVDPVVCRMQQQVSAFDYARQAAEMPFPGGVRTHPPPLPLSKSFPETCCGKTLGSYAMQMLMLDFAQATLLAHTSAVV